MTVIVFDLGGVLEIINVNATIDALSKLGHKNPRAFFTREAQSSAVTEFETGKLLAKDFCDAIRAQCSEPV